jgi:hypothetical protein
MAFGARFAVAAAAAAVLGAGVLGACGGDDNSAAPYNPEDAGGFDSSATDGGTDSQAQDAQGDASEEASPPPATITFLHASGLRSVRLCWAIDGVVTSDRPFPPYGTMMPESNYAGIPVGGTALLADASALAGHTVTFYAFDAETFAMFLEPGHTDKTCASWVNDKTLDPAIIHQFVDTTGIASAPGNVVALTGPATAPTTQVITTPAMPGGGQGSMAVEAILLSPGLAATAGDSGVSVSFGSGGAEAAAPQPIAQLTALGDVEPASVVYLHPATDLASFGAQGVFVQAGAADAGVLSWTSLVRAQSFVDPTEDPRDFFGRPVTYLIAVLGDPNSDSGLSGYELHTLVVPAH